MAAISQEKLQDYCNAWLTRAIARQFGIAQLVVDERLMLQVNLEPGRARFVDDRVFILSTSLLDYIIDQHFETTDDRRLLHAAVRDTRDR